MNTQQEIKKILDQKVKQYNKIDFIAKDPICIPHQFKKQQDIEIAGFFAAIFAWGNRTTIINKSKELLQRMDNAPYEFCIHQQPKDLKKLLGFVHRTFNDTDLLYCVEFFKQHYSKQPSLETAFFSHQITGKPIKNVEAGLTHFQEYFFSLEDAPHRTKKTYCQSAIRFHLQTPQHVFKMDGSTGPTGRRFWHLEIHPARCSHLPYRCARSKGISLLGYSAKKTN